MCVAVGGRAHGKLRCWPLGAPPSDKHGCCCWPAGKCDLQLTPLVSSCPNAASAPTSA